MKRTLYIIICLFIILINNRPIHAQSETSLPQDAAEWAKRAARFGKGLPQEKVYLHMDNTCYFVGDTIWYKGYVTRTDKGCLTNLSNILYVELFTPDGYLVERQQLKMENGSAHGAFALKDSLYAGYYELRAYTRWMLNFGAFEARHATWSEKMFYNKQMAKAFFRDYDKLYSRVFPVFNKPQKAGEYNKYMTVRPLQRYNTSKDMTDAVCSFYPEGGRLIAGTSPRIAFEINTKEGEHINGVTLTITDRDGKKVTETKSVHRGRGYFILPDVASDGKYKATFYQDGTKYEFKLPKPEPEGCCLKVTQNESVLQISILSGNLPEGDMQHMGLQIMHQGVESVYKDLNINARSETTVEIPLSQLSTGVNQLTLFDDDGRIHADRLYFVNNHDFDTPALSVNGIKAQYEPFEPVNLQLQLTSPTDGKANLSLAVRDNASHEASYDNGTILTEMLLSSELKGFVESPEFYFERDDSLHRFALDLLMMVQGWRRYNWSEMSGKEPFALTWMPEKNQTIAGCVNKVVSLEVDEEYDNDALWAEREETLASTLSHDEKSDNPNRNATTYETQPFGYSEESAAQTQNKQPYHSPNRSNETFQDQFSTQLGNLKREVNVLATYTQGKDIVERLQKTEQGTFYMETPIFYDHCYLFLSAADTTKTIDDLIKSRQKDFTDEEQYPDYYVKLNRFFPILIKDYDYYRDALPIIAGQKSIEPSDQSLTLRTVTVKSKRHGRREIDFSKPALVIDAYEAFNLAADYGLNAGTYDWKNFSRQFAMAILNDMGMERRYFIQERYDGRAVNFRQTQASAIGKTINGINITSIKVPETSKGGKQYIDAFHKLKNLEYIKLYTSYAPRERGNDKYSQSNQPDLIIDYRRFENDGYQHTYRDRRYVLQGFNVCEDFYNPDYSQKPLPGTTDYRRTLYWNPNVEFNTEGRADIRFYNNAKPTVINLEAEGMTGSGRPLVLKQTGNQPQ